MPLIIYDPIDLRRPKFEYVCPPVCENQFSSTGFPTIVTGPGNPPPTHVAVTSTVDGFVLTWDEYPNALFYTIYRGDSATGSFSILVEQQDKDTKFAFVPSGCYRVSATTENQGESELSAAVCTQI